MANDAIVVRRHQNVAIIKVGVERAGGVLGELEQMPDIGSSARVGANGDRFGQRSLRRCHVAMVSVRSGFSGEWRIPYFSGCSLTSMSRVK